MKGGDLEACFSPYQSYISVDTLYGDSQTGFTLAQTYGNIVEMCMAFTAVYLKNKPLGVLLALLASALTFYKTAVLYVPTAYIGGHLIMTDLPRFVLLYVIPTSFWIVFPLAATLVLSRQLLDSYIPKPWKKKN